MECDRPALHREQVQIHVGTEVHVWESSNRWSENTWKVTGMLVIPGETTYAEVQPVNPTVAAARIITLRHLTPACRPLPWRPAEPTVWI